MRGPQVRPIVIAAGGTGGHFFPAEALAGELLRRGERVVLMTDARSGGLASPVFANCERFVIRGAGIAGRGAVKAIRAGVALALGTVQARRILSRLHPSVVVAFGGYPSVAPVLGATLLRPRPKIILHEQNAVLGRANRFLARFAGLLALSHAETAGVPANIVRHCTGNPVRPAVASLGGGAYTVPVSDRINLLVLGGSLGARVFSDVVPAAVALLSPDLQQRLDVTQQCRDEDIERVRTAYAALGMAAILSPFFADMAGLLRNAHLVIARAGASTVAELALAGRPSILVPLPGAIDDHQTANARALGAVGAAWIVAQPGFTPETLAQRIGFLLENPGELTRAAAAAMSVARPNATAELADLVSQYAHQESRK